MDELHRNGPFTNARSDAFDRAVANIANGKQPGNIGLKQKRISVEHPPLRVLPLSYEVGTSQDEPAIVTLNQIREPVGSRQRSDKDEHCARRHPLYLVCIQTKE